MVSAEGAPCWVDLASSGPARARRFYADLFGWEPGEPDEGLGGYFTFRKGPDLVAGCAAARPDRGRDVWTVYLLAGDAGKAVGAALANGATPVVSPEDLGGLGTLAIILDPGRAHTGIWQPRSHQGFGAVGAPGTPVWFELMTKRYRASVSFYRDTFGLDAVTAVETENFRYTNLDRDGQHLAGIMDVGRLLPAGAPSHWETCFGVEDLDQALASVRALEGQVLQAPRQTPYGRLANVADPMGATFALVEQDFSAA